MSPNGPNWLSYYSKIDKTIRTVHRSKWAEVLYPTLKEDYLTGVISQEAFLNEALEYVDNFEIIKAIREKKDK